MEKAIGLLGIIVLIVLLIILGPLLTIWALNTLFPVLNIPMNWHTWAAAAVLGGLFRTTVHQNKD